MVYVETINSRDLNNSYNTGNRHYELMLDQFDSTLCHDDTDSLWFQSVEPREKVVWLHPRSWRHRLLKIPAIWTSWKHPWYTMWCCTRRKQVTSPVQLSQSRQIQLDLLNVPRRKSFCYSLCLHNHSSNSSRPWYWKDKGRERAACDCNHKQPFLFPYPFHTVVCNCCW